MCKSVYVRIRVTQLWTEDVWSLGLSIAGTLWISKYGLAMPWVQLVRDGEMPPAYLAHHITLRLPVQPSTPHHCEMAHAT